MLTIAMYKVNNVSFHGQVLFANGNRLSTVNACAFLNVRHIKEIHINDNHVSKLTIYHRHYNNYSTLSVIYLGINSFTECKLIV